MPATNVNALRALLSEKFPGLRMHLDEPRAAKPVQPTGVALVDALLHGGFPQGALTEIVSARGGSSTLIRQLLQKAAVQNRIVAFIDGCDSLDVATLDEKARSRLLWIRCHAAEEAVKAADLILRDGNLPLVERELIDFLRSTIPNVGGITAFRKLAALCEAHGVTMVPHFTAPIATAAVVHALLASPTQVMNEVLRPALPPYLGEAYIHKDGKMYRNDRPGLGAVVDERQLTAVATITEARPPELYQGEPIQRPDGSHLYL